MNDGRQPAVENPLTLSRLQEQVLGQQYAEAGESLAVPTALSTNTWTHLAPTGTLPEQIHPNNFKLGEGGVVTVGPIDSITSNHYRAGDNQPN